MCYFQTELESAINEFTDHNQPFTAWDVRNKIRDLFAMLVRYREANYAVLTHMQHNARSLGYVAQSIEVLTGKVDSDTGQSEVANVWQFTPMADVLKNAKVTQTVVSDSNDDDDQLVASQPSGGSFFARLFRR